MIMPPKRKSAPFAWDEERKRVVIDCLTRVRETGGTVQVMQRELLRQFVVVYPDCKLAAKTLYMYASKAGHVQLPGETVSHVSRWTVEKDAFLIECVLRALEENQRSLELGLRAGKVGCHGQFRNLVTQFFEERYPNEHTSDAVFTRISNLRKEKRIPENGGAGSVGVKQTTSTGDSQSMVESGTVEIVQVCDNLKLFFNSTMKYWELGFKFSLIPMFVGVCAKCSCVLINDARSHVKITTLPQQPNVFTYYEANDVALKVVADAATNKCYVCASCDKWDLLAQYRLAPSPVTNLPLPKVISDLGDEDKRQICLVALKSNTAKASSEALRIFKHQRGDFMTQRKGDACYFDMYAMIVSRQPVAKNISSGNAIIIVAALQWLRKNNHLYGKFAANYETLLRFVKRKPGQPTTLPVLSDVDFDPAVPDQTKTSVLDGEQAALMIPANNVPSRGVNVANTVTATQHVRSFQQAKGTHAQLVNVFVKDTYLEAKVFPWLFPYGIGGWCNAISRGFTRGAYVRWRLRMCDGRFRDCADYMFYMLDVIIKERLQYYASVKVNVAKLAEPLTVQKLREAGTNPYHQYGTEVPASIPNSRNYWASKTLDLIGMSQYMGRVPDFFVTLTENDSWPELQAIIRDGMAGVHETSESKEFENVHKRGAPAMKFPMQTVVAFYRRLQEFRRRFLQDPNGPFGKVLDFWIRIEYQKRGSLHAHLVVWCEEGTVPDGVVSAEMPRYDHPHNGKWRDIVGSIQKHECYQQRCYTGYKGKVLSSCKYGFPYALNDTALPEKSGVRYRYMRRNREDCRVIPYNLQLLLFWDGHVNVQMVTNGGWELYLAKYVAKSEYPIRMRLSHKRQSDCETYLKTRVVSILETATLLQHYPHVFCSREVIYLPISVNPSYRFLKRISDTIDKTGNTVNDDISLYYDTKLEKYLDRPNVLCDLTYPQFFAQYRYRQSPRENEVFASDVFENDDIDFINGNDVAVGDNSLTAVSYRDKKGRVVCERVRHEAIVRFKEYSPYGNELEMYCLTKLLQTVPVDRESLAALKDATGSYLEECLNRNLISAEDEAKQFLEGAAKRGISLDRLREMASRLIDGNWLHDQDIDQLLETVAPYQMQAKRVRAETVEDDDDNVVIVDNHERDGLDLNIRTYLPVTEYISEFTESQRAAFEFVTDAWQKGEQCLALITGGGGVGKSFLLDSLVAFCNEHQRTVQKLATTGCAAHLIGGVTIHTFLRMTPDLESHIERGTTDAYLIDRLEVLLIDEVSMLEERVMMKLEDCMSIHSRSHNSQNNSLPSRFAGKSVIMFGDPAQLPPVGRHIWQPALLKGFQFVVLKEIVRQKGDRVFTDLLNRVRLGKPNEADIDLLKTRIVTNAQLQQIEIGDRGLMLFPTRRQKDEINALELAKLPGTERIYSAEDVDGSDNPLPTSVREFIAKLEKKIQLLPASLTLKIGARVMLIRNRDIEHGWVNGKLATVVSMSDNYVVIAAIDDPSRRLITFRVRQEIRNPDTTQQVFRQQFPLDLAYGVTIHKSQGQTLDVIAVSASCLGFSGQFYTAISRVRKLDGLYLMEFDRDAIFLASDVGKLIEWMNEVDVTRPKSSDWVRPTMPEVSHNMSNLGGWKVSIAPNKDAVDVSTNTTKRVHPMKTVVDDNHAAISLQQFSDHHISKKRQRGDDDDLLIDDILDRIHRIDTERPLEIFFETFDTWVNEEIREQCDQWIGRLERERGCVFDETIHPVDRIRTQQIYSVISEQNGRVVQTLGDGSCLFHALSLCLLGQQFDDRKLRLLCCLIFRRNATFYETEHCRNQLDYVDVQQLIHQTSNLQGGQDAWGGPAHLHAMATIARREIYVYMGFVKITGNDGRCRIDPKYNYNRDLSLDELQRIDGEGTMPGAYFCRYVPMGDLQDVRPLTVLYTDVGSAAHFSAILPVVQEVPLVIPKVVIPPPPPIQPELMEVDEIIDIT